MGFEGDKVSAEEVRQVAGQILLGRLEAFSAAMMMLAGAIEEEDGERARELVRRARGAIKGLSSGDVMLADAFASLYEVVIKEIAAREKHGCTASAEAAPFPFADGLIPSQN